jgi:DNA polymerase-3 subunit gamma/tau
LKSIFARKKDKPHVYLLQGPSGCGKTTIGRILSTMLNCSEMDFREYNSSNTRGIDTIREISQNAYYAPTDGSVKVYLLDEVHQLTKDAQNAILKILEDCPNHVFFILCTTEPEKLLKTIHTRCTTYQVKPLTDAEIKGLINRVLRNEIVEGFPENVIDEIVRVAEGCPRQALVILDQVIDIEDDKKALEAVFYLTVGEAEVLEICQGIMKNKSWKELKGRVDLVLKNTEPEKLRYAILGYMQAVLLDVRGFSKPNDYEKASALIELFSENTYSGGKALLVSKIYNACK